MTIFDTIRDLIKKAEGGLTDLEKEKPAQPEVAISKENLVKGFRKWIEEIQVDLVNGKTDQYSTPEENAMARLETFIKTVEMVKNIESVKKDSGNGEINEMFSRIKQNLLSDVLH